MTQQSFSVAEFWRELSAKPFRPRVQATSLDGLLGPCRAIGDCLAPVMPEADVRFYDPRIEPQDGDFVAVEVCDFRHQHVLNGPAGQRWIEKYGTPPTRTWVKLFKHIHGRPYLLCNSSMFEVDEMCIEWGPEEIVRDANGAEVSRVRKPLRPPWTETNKILGVLVDHSQVDPAQLLERTYGLVTAGITAGAISERYPVLSTLGPVTMSGNGTVTSMTFNPSLMGTTGEIVIFTTFLKDGAGITAGGYNIRLEIDHGGVTTVPTLAWTVSNTNTATVLLTTGPGRALVTDGSQTLKLVVYNWTATGSVDFSQITFDVVLLKR